MVKCCVQRCTPTVHQLRRPDCDLIYAGQTEKQLNIRYKGQILALKYNNNQYSFAQRLINNGHAMGLMEEIMGVVRTAYKGRSLDTTEKYYIYRETIRGKEIKTKMQF
jgi:hypothetical protein